MPKLVAPIVGMQFRPPAILLLSVLPTGHPLIIESEPSNEHDPDALRVLLDHTTLDLDNEQISKILTNAHLSSQTAIDDWVNNHVLHLGYVARSNNLRSCIIDGKSSIGNAEIISVLATKGMISPIGSCWKYPAKLTFSMSGQSLVEVTVP